jgi:hypothetical protein
MDSDKAMGEAGIEAEEEAVISEAASEKEAIRAEFAIELMQACLPRRSDEERAEQEAWKSDKPKRGRPRLDPYGAERHKPIDKHYDGIGWLVGSTAKTGRGRQDAQYAGDAMKALFKHRHDHPEVLELTGVEPVAAKNGREAYEIPGIINARKNIGVLAELGRLINRYGNGEEVAVAWAVELARMEPRLTSKQAVAWLRQRRLRKSNLGNTVGLMDAITGAIDGYLASHPGTSQRMIVEALQVAAGIFEPEDEDDA